MVAAVACQSRSAAPLTAACDDAVWLGLWLVVSELAPTESSEPEVARERVALAGVARREVLADAQMTCISNYRVQTG